MNLATKNNLMKIFNNETLSLKEMYSLFYVDNLEDFVNLIKDFVNNNIDELLFCEDNFFNKYHLFLYDLVDKISTNDEYYLVSNLIKSNYKALREQVRSYNKFKLKKDTKYFKCTKALGEIDVNQRYIEDTIINNRENIDFKMIWFIVTDLKKEDYLFRIIGLYPDMVNIKSANGKSLFNNLLDYYLSSLNDLSDEDIKYYKRIFVMMLESDNLNISTNDLFNILEILEKNLISCKFEKKKDINFLINEINSHYEVINGDGRINALSYINKPCPTDVRTKFKSRDRVDLTDLFTVSIDSVNSDVVNNLLIDDAVSIVDNKDGTMMIYVHIPDVDHFVKKNSKTDNYMRGISETIYKKEFRTPMLNYEISKLSSLNQGSVRPALTFMFKMDYEGNLLDIDFKESLVNVNYNLSKRKADIFLSECNDQKLQDSLKLLYEMARVLKKSRKVKIGKCSKASLIMEEYNIMLDILVAEYFNNEGIVFPYKNYLGLRSDRNKEHLNKVIDFINEYELDAVEQAFMYDIFDINNRVYYDTNGLPNSSYNGRIAGNVGNPLREYISLETDRIIKDILVNGEKNYDYWEERIERDVIEYTEKSSKIRALYNK